MKSSRMFSNLLLATVLSAMAFFYNGCVVVAAGAAGAGAVAYIRGELQATPAQTLETTERATNQALTQLELIKISEKKDAFVALFVARTADDKKVEIKLTKLSPDTTKVQIRVGLFGDEARSLAILEKIKANF